MKNRGQLIEIFVSNLANSIVHQILEKATDEQIYIDGYGKEMRNSRQIAENYRGKINPIDMPLPVKDAEEVRQKLKSKVNAELRLRISGGYKNINLELVEELVSLALKELKVV